MQSTDEDKKLKIAALALMVSNKIVSKEVLDGIWGEVRQMKLKILEVAEEKGIEQGIEVTIKVQKMYKAGISTEMIAAELGISEADVSKLIDLLKDEQLI